MCRVNLSALSSWWKRLNGDTRRRDRREGRDRADEGDPRDVIFWPRYRTTPRRTGVIGDQNVARIEAIKNNWTYVWLTVKPLNVAVSISLIVM